MSISGTWIGSFLLETGGCVFVLGGGGFVIVSEDNGKVPRFFVKRFLRVVVGTAAEVGGADVKELRNREGFRVGGWNTSFVVSKSCDTITESYL